MGVVMSSVSCASGDGGGSPLFALIVIVIMIMLVAPNVCAQVQLEYVPEGDVVQTRDGDVIQYTFEQFLEIAELDVRYRGLLLENDGLREMMILQEQAYAQMEMRIEGLEESLDHHHQVYGECAMLRDEAVDSLGDCTGALNRALSRRERWHPVWGPVALTSTALVLGAITYGVVR